MLHAREKRVSSVKLENPFSESHSLSHTNDLIQDKDSVNMVTVHMPSVAAQTSLTNSEFQADSKVAIVSQRVARSLVSADSRICTE